MRVIANVRGQLLRAIGLAAVLLALPLIALADSFSLSAKPGHFNVKTLGPAVAKGTLSATIRITNFDGGQGWPPAAYVGFHQGTDRNQSVQLLVIRNEETDAYVVAGYRVIENGKEATIESLANLPLKSIVRVRLSFDKGAITLLLNDQSPITLRTPFTQVRPYVSVSSGTAEFTVDP